MKKVFCLSSLFFFLSSFFSVVLKAQTHRLVIKVISADRKEPIEGATIKIEAKANHFSDRRFDASDWEGMAYQEYAFDGTFSINAEATGYYGSIQVVIIKPKDPSGDIQVTLILRRQAGVKLVVVEVFEKGIGALLYDAQVNLKGAIYSYNGSTNSSGEAVIAVDHGDNYAVTISHAGYKTVTDHVSVKEFDDEKKEYGLSIEMTPTNNNERRTMYVKVQTRRYADAGAMWGVPYASVTFSYENTVFEHNADEEGIDEFTHSIPPGEQVTITVKMQGYKSQSKKISIKSRGFAGNAVDGAVFTLIKGKDESRFLLNVEVLDDKTNDPVPDASVELKKPDGSVEKNNTNTKGEARFSGIESGKPGTSAKVMVTKTGYKEKWSDISSELMSGNENSERQFVVYLTKREDVVDWNGTFTDTYSTFSFSGNSASVSADWTYTVGASKGTCSLKSIKMEGNKATGTWSGQHEDDTKTGSRSGTFTLTFNGNTITGQLVEDTPNWSYKAGYSAANVNSSMHKGSVWAINISRKK